MILLGLGLIDLIGAVLILLTLIGVTITGTAFIFGILLIIKGIYSLATMSMFGGITDIIAALFLFFLASLTIIPPIIVLIVGALLLIKSLQSIVFSVL